MFSSVIPCKGSRGWQIGEGIKSAAHYKSAPWISEEKKDISLITGRGNFLSFSKALLNSKSAFFLNRSGKDWLSWAYPLRTGTRWNTDDQSGLAHPRPSVA